MVEFGPGYAVHTKFNENLSPILMSKVRLSLKYEKQAIYTSEIKQRLHEKVITVHKFQGFT